MATSTIKIPYYSGSFDATFPAGATARGFIEVSRPSNVPKGEMLSALIKTANTGAGIHIQALNNTTNNIGIVYDKSTDNVVTATINFIVVGGVKLTPVSLALLPRGGGRHESECDTKTFSGLSKQHSGVYAIIDRKWEILPLVSYIGRGYRSTSRNNCKGINDRRLQKRCILKESNSSVSISERRCA